MNSDVKNAVRRQFTQNAGDYRDEPLFAQGDDLTYMVESVLFTGTEQVLDVGTGAGHTALVFAPHVAHCIGCDLTTAMVEVAANYAKEQGVLNAKFLTADAEALPFPEASFDFVTCRFAAHHFSNLRGAVHEISRVLKPGGTFLLVDHYAPEDSDLDNFVNTLDVMRDPSHVREYRLSEYKAQFEEAGLSYSEKRHWDLPLQFDNWIRRARTPREMKYKLVEFLRTACNHAKETFRIELDQAAYPVSFCLNCALLHGVKNE